MPYSPQERGGFIRRAREAMRAVKRLERDTLLQIRVGLAEARADLISRLGSGTEFSQANTLALLREADRAAFEVERLLGSPITNAQRAAETLAEETFRANMKAQGFDVSSVRPLIKPAEIVIVQREVIGDLVVAVTAEFKQNLRSNLRRSLMGQESLAQFQGRIGRSLNSPSVFGTVMARAEVIMRNETSNTFALAQAAQREQVKASGFEFTKTWVTSRDARVRPSHAALDGKTIGQDEEFDVGGWAALYPKDPRLPPEETIQCRCALVEQWNKTKPTAGSGRSINPVAGIPEISVVA